MKRNVSFPIITWTVCLSHMINANKVDSLTKKAIAEKMQFFFACYAVLLQFIFFPCHKQTINSHKTAWYTNSVSLLKFK